MPVDPVTVWKERKANADFAALYEDARIAGAQLLEEEATRRAAQGVRKLKFFEGQMITYPTGKTIKNDKGEDVPEFVPYVEHEYSDTLLALLLKRHFPAEYREKPPEVNVTANSTTNVTIVVTAAEQAAFQAREKLALEALLSGRN